MYSIQYTKKKTEDLKDLKECIMCSKAQTPEGGEFGIYIARGVSNGKRLEEWRHWMCVDTPLLMKIGRTSAVRGFSELLPKDRRRIRTALKRLSVQVLSQDSEVLSDDSGSEESNSDVEMDVMKSSDERFEDALTDKKPRGRPRKHPLVTGEEIKKKRGRPRKEDIVSIKEEHTDSVVKTDIYRPIPEVAPAEKSAAFSPSQGVSPGTQSCRRQSASPGAAAKAPNNTPLHNSESMLMTSTPIASDVVEVAYVVPKKRGRPSKADIARRNATQAQLLNESTLAPSSPVALEQSISHSASEGLGTLSIPKKPAASLVNTSVTLSTSNINTPSIAKDFDVKPQLESLVPGVRPLSHPSEAAIHIEPTADWMSLRSRSSPELLYKRRRIGTSANTNTNAAHVPMES